MVLDPVLKQKISEELSKEAPDWRVIERLSRDRVDEDPNSIRFSVDAGHLSRLGLELVAKQETALAELIKNAYDADATRVIVEFKNHDRAFGTLVITDDGIGMPADVVRSSWMRLSTTHKSEQPFSPIFGRVRAGRKGIGRFAVQRLGKRLLLETEVAGLKHGTQVMFDWEAAFNPGENLSDIFSEMRSYEKPVERHGTRLTIHQLREKWAPAAIERVWRTILTLQSPFTAEIRNEPVDGGEDPGFEVELNGTTSASKRSTLGIESGFLDHSLAQISGEIDEHGRASVRVISRQLGLDDRMEHEQLYLLTGPIKFAAKYFIYKRDSLPGLKVNIAQEMGREYGGIRIYRNNFRVAPYGERADDWLKLDRDTSRRTLLVPANNVNFFGHVTLSRESNPLFEETSSREGLIENEAFEELRAFVRSSVEWAVKRVASVRGRKQTASQRDFVSTVKPQKPSEVLDELAELLGINSSSGDSERPLPQAARASFLDMRDRLLAWEGDVEKRQEEALQYEEMLRILASLGLSISVFAHEIKGMRSSVAANVEVLQDYLTRLGENLNPRLDKIVTSLKSSTGRMFDLGGYIAGLMTSTESRQLRTLSVKGAAERFRHQFESYLSRQNIDFQIILDRDELRTVEMHSSELDSILLNFLTNSIKSMKRAKVSPRKILLRAKEDGRFVVLSFQDNGLGIAESNRERVFDAFFTTSSGSDDVLAGPGTGLGLKIVQDIATSYGGSVIVADPEPGYSCNIEFRIPAYGRGVANDT